jgi:citrate lyase subunit beta/citryl-CoA lyase
VFYPKLAGHAQLVQMGQWLDALEKRDGTAATPVQIIGIITESARAVAGEQAASLARGHPRLRGYSWGVEDLSADLGRAPLTKTPAADRQIAASAQLHCLYLAAAAGAEPIDSVSTAIRDTKALAETCDHARALGYTGKMAIHPAQVGPINAHMAPDPDTLDWARRVQALVREHPERSAFSLDGRMVDKPHIEVARRILEQAGEPVY